MPDPKFIRRDHPKDPSIISSHAIVSHRTGRGIVEINWNNEGGQFDPEDARRFAHELLRQADIAETDAFLYQFFKEKIGIDDGRLGQFITDFRNHRAKLEQIAGLRPTGQPVPEDDVR